MKRKRPLTALTLALALLLTGALTAYAAASDSTVYLLAANDKFCDRITRPVSVNGVIYVPYTVFDKTATGVDLGVYYGLSQEQGTTLSLYSMERRLTFRVTMGSCEDGKGNVMNFRALFRYSIPYVPAAAVCEFFGLGYSFLPTADRGTLIRITSVTASLSDSLFLSSARSSMLERYNNILQGREPLATAAPAASQEPGVTSPDKSGIRVYLSVDASNAADDLTGAFSGSVRALFLFTPDSLADQADQVRSAVAAGHSVGLIVDGELEDAREQLRRGNELLAHIARVNTHIVSAPDALTDALEREGWRCWKGYAPGSTSNAVLNWLDSRRGTVRLDLPAVSTFLSRVVSTLRQDGYHIRQPLETDL